MAKNRKSSSNGSLLETSPSLQTHPSRDELYAQGKSLRDLCPRHSHAVWKPAENRADPLDLVLASNEDRIAQLIPIRHGRMMQSPFAFYRGAALNMAADLANTPTSGIRVQACGDCHLMNFGAFATPERRMIFDINDLDETLPAPWEWDVKRLAASIVVASRNNGFSEEQARDAVLACIRSYRERMREYSEMHVMDVWYASIDMESLEDSIDDEEANRRFHSRLAKARGRSVVDDDFPDLVHTGGLSPTIKENPPLIYHWRESGHEELLENVKVTFARYRTTIQEDRRLLLDRFKLTDVAIKVVGVGSVGTYCGILLLMASEQDPLFLQFKQARRSVLEPYVGKSLHQNQGERIVHGYRMMQSASDLFLGWTEGQHGRHYYIRQLKDMKIKPLVESFTPGVMRQYAEICGWTLSHAHARSSQPLLITGYLGKSDKFDEAIADFANAYADQSEQDYATLLKAVKAGKLEVFVEEP